MIEIESKFGNLTYGLRPEGYDAWVFRQTGGGGEVTLPFSYSPNGQLLIGLVKENRANMGEDPVWCIIGGFVGPKELQGEAQVRRAADEAGLDTRKARKIGGANPNCNRLFFVVDAKSNEGDVGFALMIPPDHLEPDGDCWKLSNTALLPDYKKTSEVRFFPWRTIAKICPDGIANSVLLKFIAEVL
jgi:ADP-ribose pyrophosphatase YjhB (NUDIX family)